MTNLIEKIKYLFLEFRIRKKIRKLNHIFRDYPYLHGNENRLRILSEASDETIRKILLALKNGKIQEDDRMRPPTFNLVLHRKEDNSHWANLVDETSHYRALGIYGKGAPLGWTVTAKDDRSSMEHFTQTFPTLDEAVDYLLELDLDPESNDPYKNSFTYENGWLYKRLREQV